MRKHLVTLVVALGLTGCAGTDHWSYSGNTGPDKWAELAETNSVCSNGINQSPINLQSPVEAELEPLLINYSSAATDIVNNGHTVQVNIAAGSRISGSGQAFVLKQVHFHSPSENLIAGQSFPLEAHFVHADLQGNLAVLAVMFKAGLENRVLKRLWTKMPVQSGQKHSLSNFIIDISKLLPTDKSYYRYNGSLTTPPCTEGVRWFVLKQPVEVSMNQVQQFLDIMQHENNRPVQPINARVILK